jgi:hypothetical protein
LTLAASTFAPNRRAAAHAQRAADTTLARSGFEAVPIRIGA